MKNLVKKFNVNVHGANAGMELVQVAILIAIAIALGLIFKTQILKFVNGVFDNLDKSGF